MENMPYQIQNMYEVTTFKSASQIQKYKSRKMDRNE